MLVQGGERCLGAAAAATTAQESFSSSRDVTYSCGSCGYALNLSSSNRNTTNFGSKYGKAIKKGIISFFSVDESRFSKSEEYICIPYFTSKHTWGLFRQRTKLLCRKCGNLIGVAYGDGPARAGLGYSDSSSGDGTTSKKYDIKISALQPASDESIAPFSYDLCTKNVATSYIG